MRYYSVSIEGTDYYKVIDVCCYDIQHATICACNALLHLKTECPDARVSFIGEATHSIFKGDEPRPLSKG